jgi:nitrogen-specific signal transduction histidine kinase
VSSKGADGLDATSSTAGPSATSAPPPDATALNRVQQDNQRQLVGKLLHDLRNPIHSIRISMELFGRLARRNGDLDKLMERAALYIDPAESAITSLVANSERLSRYLAAAALPETQTLQVDELLSEVVSLLRASKRRLQVTSTLSEPPTPAVRADRMRLCHVLLHSCLNNAASVVTISVRAANGMVTFDLAFQAGAADDAVRATPLSAQELRLIVETGGGALLAASDAALSMEFRRANDPPSG